MIDTLKEKQLISQFISFAGVGIIGTAGQYATLILLVQLFDIQAVLSSGFGAVVGALINYYLNYKDTGPAKDALYINLMILKKGLVHFTLLPFSDVLGQNPGK